MNEARCRCTLIAACTFMAHLSEIFINCQLEWQTVKSSHNREGTEPSQCFNGNDLRCDKSYWIPCIPNVFREVRSRYPQCTKNTQRCISVFFFKCNTYVYVLHFPIKFKNGLPIKKKTRLCYVEQGVKDFLPFVQGHALNLADGLLFALLIRALSIVQFRTLLQ